MSSMFFVFKRSIVNYIKGLKNKPAALIGYIFILLFIVGMIVFSILMPSQLVSSGKSDTLTAIMGVVIIGFSYFAINNGIEKGSSYFRLSDVNLIFTAPIKSNKVLIYGFIKQLPGVLLILLLFFFQVPNIKNHFEISNGGVLIALLAIALLVIQLPLLSMIIYNYSSKSPKRKKNAKLIFNGITFALVIVFIIEVLKYKDLMTALRALINNKVFECFPFIGWSKLVSNYMVYPIDVLFFVGIGISILSIFFMIVVLYKMEPDYYEDVLSATEHMETMIKVKREGKGNMSIQTGKIKNVKQEFSMNGAAAIFQKNILEIRKTGFLLFDKITVMIIAFGIVMRYLMPSMANGMIITLFFSVYMLLLTAVQGKWAQELSKPYIYLIPDSNISKLFFATAPENIKNFVDGIVLFVISGVLFKEKLSVTIVCIFTYFSFSAVYLYGDVVTRRVFGNVHSKVAGLFFRIIFMFLIVVPGIAILIITNTVFESFLLSIILLALWNMLVAFIMLLIGQSVMNNVEVN